MVVLLALSVTTHVKVLTPFKKVNVGLLFTIETTEQLSEVVGVPVSVKVKTAWQLPLSLFT